MHGPAFWAHFGGHRGRGFRGGRSDFFSELFGGPPPRADRGVVRYLILDALSQQPRHGYEVIQAIEERSAGTYRPSPGVVYPTLQLLEELGHARVEEQEARKVYALTDEGREDLAEHADEVRDFYDHAGEASWDDFAEELTELTQRAGRMFKALGRAGRRGRLTPAMMKKVKVVLDEAIAKIEGLVETER